MNTQLPIGQWIRKSLVEGLVILIAVVGLALVFNTLRDGGIPLFQATSPPAVQNGASGTAASLGFYTITFEDALQHFQSESAVFVDARSPEAYRQGHIPGAVNLPDPQFDEFFGPFFEKTDPETVIIAYCEGENCPLSANLAQKLRDAGYERVFVLKDGWGQWKRRDLPVDRGK